MPLVSREKHQALITLQGAVDDEKNNTKYQKGYGNRNELIFQ